MLRICGPPSGSNSTLRTLRVCRPIRRGWAPEIVMFSAPTSETRDRTLLGRSAHQLLNSSKTSSQIGQKFCLDGTGVSQTLVTGPYPQPVESCPYAFDLHIRLYFQVVYTPRGFLTKILCVFHISPCLTRVPPKLKLCHHIQSLNYWPVPILYLYELIFPYVWCFNSFLVSRDLHTQNIPRSIFEPVVSVCPWPLGSTSASYLR
jgi:hypothetical protein